MQVEIPAAIATLHQRSDRRRLAELAAEQRLTAALWDLWTLNEIGAIDDAAAETYRRYGPTRRLPGPYLFKNPPAEADWQSQLAGQTRLTATATTALDEVREAGHG